MIKSAEAMERIARFQQQVLAVATSPENYRASATGYLPEIDRMMLAARDCFWAPPAKASGEMAAA